MPPEVAFRAFTFCPETRELVLDKHAIKKHKTSTLLSVKRDAQ